MRIKSGFAALWLGATFLAAPGLAQVSGNCFLDGAVDHSGTKVKFLAASPAAVTDSTLTEASGDFAISLAAGLYTIQYRHEGYLPHDVTTPAFFGSTPVVLADVTLEPGTVIEVSGRPGSSHWVSGTIVRVVGNVIIDPGETLTIDPGVTVLFAGYYALGIFGRAEFLGAEGDSIIFASELAGAGPGAYNYVSFNGCATGEVRHCVFRHAGAIQLGGSCQNPPATPFELHHCLVERTHYGITMGEGKVRVADTLVRNNTYYGIWASYCDTSTVIERCTIQDIPLQTGLRLESCTGTRVRDCLLQDVDPLRAFARGIDARGSSPLISGCTVLEAEGAGIEQGQGTSLALIEGCVLEGNGTGILAATSLATIRNCTLAGNLGAGIAIQNSPAGGGPALLQNVVAGNGTGIAFDSAVEQAAYNDLWGNTVQYAGAQTPFMFGQEVSVNGNGDPADVYLNIFLEPLFVAPAAGDYALQAASPCIDAGDPARLDPDGTTADLGAFWFDQSLAGAPPAAAAGLVLRQNVPNPFNPLTAIRFELGAAARVRLTVHDLAGRAVRTLLDGMELAAGEHRAVWDGRDAAGRPVAAGVYLLSLEAGGRRVGGRMTLVR